MGGKEKGGQKGGGGHDGDQKPGARFMGRAESEIKTRGVEERKPGFLSQLARPMTGFRTFGLDLPPHLRLHPRPPARTDPRSNGNSVSQHRVIYAVM